MDEIRSDENAKAALALEGVSMRYGANLVLEDIDVKLRAGSVTCLLGDNGAGKSTLIKIMSGVVQASTGSMLYEGSPVHLKSPRHAQDLGIWTVHQDVGILPLMSVARNFFLGHEITHGWGPLRRIDSAKQDAIAMESLRTVGVRRVRSGEQAAGTLSGGERQAIAIGRAVHFGAKVLILDEPTSALGTREAAVVLRLVKDAASRGLSVVVITHNAQHAMAVGDRFTVLIRGRVADSFARGERSHSELLNLMAGGERVDSLSSDTSPQENPST